MSKILITDNPDAIKQANAFRPRIIVARQDITDMAVLFSDETSCALEDVTDVILDGSDTKLLRKFPNALRLYLQEPLDFSADIDTIGKKLLSAELYAGPGKTPFNIEDDFLMGDDFSNRIARQNSDENKDLPAEIPLREQIAILAPLLEGKRSICEGTIAELTDNLVNLCYTQKLFMRDTTTGLFRSRFFRRSLVPETQAKMSFVTHFIDKLAIKSRTYKTDRSTGEQSCTNTYRSVRTNEIDLLWQNVSYYSTFNSRREFYNSIPKWDGEPRIGTFMKKYFECDANPHFFLLLITSIIGMIDAPDKNYCPYFFDLVSRAKGIGKTLLWRRLLGGKYVGDIKMNPSRGLSDFFVDAYDGNNIIVLDDECTWCGTKAGQISYDQFKNLVTSQTDKFSRKYRDPEEHTRCFIIVRTSNEVNQVFSTNERRQIIFKSNLHENECRILNLPPEFWQQILAEGKVFYEKHGRYVLSAEDEKDIMQANCDNFNYESPDVFTIIDFIKAVRAEPDKYNATPKAAYQRTKLWGSYEKYCVFCKEIKTKPLISRAFWRNIDAISSLPDAGIKVNGDKKYQLEGTGFARLFEIDRYRGENEEPVDTDVDDIPY